MTNLAVGYARRSSLAQRENTSLSDQMQRIQMQAEIKDLQLHFIGYDDAVSGSSLDHRHALWMAISMLKCIRCQPRPMPPKLTSDAWIDTCDCGVMDGAQALIVWDFKRFGRNSEETIFLCLHVLDRFDKRLIIVDGSIQVDTSTPTGRFMLKMMAAMAELDKDELLEKFARGRNYIKKNSSKHAVGAVPFGFKTDKQCKAGSNLVPLVDPNNPLKGEFATLKYIFLLDEYGFSHRRIAEELNKKGLKARGQGLWHPNQIWRILHESGKHYPQVVAELATLREEIREIVRRGKEGAAAKALTSS